MEKIFTLKWSLGARTAALIAQATGQFSSSVRLELDGLEVNAKDVMQIMLLLVPAKPGARFRMIIEGYDRVAAMEQLESLFTYGPQVDHCLQLGCKGAPILVDYSEKQGTTYVCENAHIWGVAQWPEKSEFILPNGKRLPGAIIPIKKEFSWPGGEQLSHRERILLESRTLEELIAATGKLPSDVNLESVFGYFEYLLQDWMWLHDSNHQEKFPYHATSWHCSSLRDGSSYRERVSWSGSLPRSNAPSQVVESFRN